MEIGPLALGKQVPTEKEITRKKFQIANHKINETTKDNAKIEDRMIIWDTWHRTIHQARWIIGTHSLRMADEILKRKYESHLELVSIDEWFIC